MCNKYLTWNLEANKAAEECKEFLVLITRLKNIQIVLMIWDVIIKDIMQSITLLVLPMGR